MVTWVLFLFLYQKLIGEGDVVKIWEEREGRFAKKIANFFRIYSQEILFCNAIGEKLLRKKTPVIELLYILEVKLV